MSNIIEFVAQMPTDTKIFLYDGSSGFDGNADSVEMADLAVGLQRSAPAL